MWFWLRFNGCDHGGFVEVSVDDTMLFNYYYGENWFSSKSGVAYSSPPLYPRTSEKTQVEKWDKLNLKEKVTDCFTEVLF